MTTWLALLRGINVGGRNRILMQDLAARFEGAGYADVRTYIQSGNVIFAAAEERSALTAAIEQMLADAFDYDATVELRDLEQMRAIVEQAPTGFGAEPDDYRYDVLFLLPPLAVDEVLGALTPKAGVDTAWPGPGVVYHSRLTARASQSGLSRIVSHPLYQRLTVRNWNTTTRLLTLME
jgi:uncharacterized protein (DUF1697 family)